MRALLASPAGVDAGRTAFAARGVGGRAVAESLPDAVVWLFSGLTSLGDPWLCLFGVCVAYVVGPRVGVARPSAAFVLALGLGAVGLTVGLKELFALPRPPGAAETGYGFPSGHALGATVFWGGMALLAGVGRRRARLGLAAGVVAVVAASRVVIGVHYLADVVAGVAVGVAFLAAVVDAGPGLRRPSVPSDRAVVACYLLGGVLAAGAAATEPVETEVLLAVGTGVGGAAVWSLLGGDAAPDGDLSVRSAAVGAVVVPIPLAAMVAVAELSLSAVAVVAAGAVGGGALLSLPAVAATLVDRK